MNRLSSRRSNDGERRDSLHQKPRECVVMEVKESQHQKPREVCITEGTESIDLEWFENTTLSRVKMGLDVCYRLAFATGNHWAHLRRLFNRCFAKRWQKLWMPKLKGKTRFILQKDHEWRNVFLYTSHLRSSQRNHDVNVSELLRSSPNPVVASVFGDSERIRRAAVCRGYNVMKFRFLNFGDDVHDHVVTGRIMATDQRI